MREKQNGLTPRWRARRASGQRVQTLHPIKHPKAAAKVPTEGARSRMAMSFIGAGMFGLNRVDGINKNDKNQNLVCSFFNTQKQKMRDCSQDELQLIRVCLLVFTSMFAYFPRWTKSAFWFRQAQFLSFWSSSVHPATTFCRSRHLSCVTLPPRVRWRRK